MKKTFIGILVLLFLVQACASPTPLPTTQPAPTESPVSVTETPVEEDTVSRLERSGG